MSIEYIAVPYQEKDEAKALGARWDQNQRSWYIPEGVNPALFSRWRKSEYAGEYFYVVVGCRMCWKCKMETTVVAIGIPYGEPYELNEDDIEEGVYPSYDPETYNALALIPRLGATPRELRDFLESEYHYQLKYSQTTGMRQLNNCCDHCGSLQGEHFDFNEPGGTFFPMSLEELGDLKFYRVPTKGMLYGLLDAWSSFDECIFQYAQLHSEELDLKIVENIYLP